MRKKNAKPFEDFRSKWNSVVSAMNPNITLAQALEAIFTLISPNSYCRCGDFSTATKELESKAEFLYPILLNSDNSYNNFMFSDIETEEMLPYFFKSSFVNLPPKDHMEFAEFSNILFESATNIPLEQSFLPYKTPNSEHVLQSRLRAELRVTLNSLEQELIKHVLTHKGIQKEVRMWCGYTLDEKKYLLYYAKISDLLYGFFTPKSIFDRDSKYTTLKSKLNGLLGVFQSLEVFNEYASFPNIFNVFCKDEDYDWEDDEDDNDEDEETAQIQKLENIYDTLIHALKETTSGDKLCSKIEERIP